MINIDSPETLQQKKRVGRGLNFKYGVTETSAVSCAG